MLDLAQDEPTPVGRYHELGSEDGEMADVLETAFKRETIFNHGRGQWHVYDPETGLWLVDKIGDVPKRVDEIAIQMITFEALSSAKDHLKRVKVYRRLRETGRIDSALRALSWRDAYKTDGSIFDRNPNLLGVRNGVLDLETMTLRRPSDFESPVRGMYVSQSVAVPWPTEDVIGALHQAQPFIAFLEDILSHDADLVNYVLRLLGYCLLGTTDQEKFWLLVGQGNNGKGTLTKLVYWLLGDYAVFLDPALYMHSRFGAVGADRARPELGNLWGKRYSVTSEPVKGKFNEEMLKAHTGEDPITFRRMRSDTMWTFSPTHKLFFTTQDPPAVEDVGPSMKRRARVLRFENDYSANPDRQLPQKLQAIGQPILVALAYQAMEYLREELPENPTVAKWSAAYLSENDPHSQFVAARCVTGVGLAAPAGPLFAEWVEWCHANYLDAGTATAFGTKMGKRFERVHTATEYHYKGLRIRGALETPG